MPVYSRQLQPLLGSQQETHDGFFIYLFSSYLVDFAETLVQNFYGQYNREESGEYTKFLV